jgi:hypothetical protein
MSYRKTSRHSSKRQRRKRTTPKRIKKRQSGGDFQLGDLTFYLTPRKEIQLFTEEEEQGILKDTLDFFNRSPDVLLQLSVPGNVRKYISNKGLDTNVFKYQVEQNGSMNKNEVLTKREITLYIFPLLVQMHQILYENALTETDPTNKGLIKGYHDFVLGLLRNVSNIINPLWFDRIYSTLSFIDFDSIPGVSTLKSKAQNLGSSIGKLFADKGAQQDVEYETKWYRGYPDDRYMEVDDMEHVFYYPVESSRYSNMEERPRMDRILNQIYSHGDMQQMPVFTQNAKHTLKRETKTQPKQKFQNVVKKIIATNKTPTSLASTVLATLATNKGASGSGP